MQTLAQKIAPDGSLLWGDPGIFVSADAGGANAPKISADRRWQCPRRLDQRRWRGRRAETRCGRQSRCGDRAASRSSPTSGFFFMADLHGDADGNAIVSWVPYIGTSHELWAQKLAAIDGANLWGTDPVQVFDGTGGALQFGNFPPFICGRRGRRRVRLVHRRRERPGPRAAHAGRRQRRRSRRTACSLRPMRTQDQFEPDGAYDPTTGDIYALWRETDVQTQSQIGVYAQRIDDIRRAPVGRRRQGAGAAFDARSEPKWSRCRSPAAA